MRHDKKQRRWPAIAAALGLALSTVGSASATTCGSMDPAAEVVQLRNACNGAANCCETSRDLVLWIGTRPAMTPLLVDVGPGTFDRLRCGTGLFDAGDPLPMYSHVTFRGSGRGQTIFKVTQCPGVCGAIDAYGTGCHDLEYMNLTADSSVYGAVWGLGGALTAGDSTWTNVEILGANIGWYEITVAGCDASNLATHRWFNSTIVARTPNAGAGWGYMANCSVSELYDSDIAVVASATTPGGTFEGFAALSVGGGAELENAGFRVGRARLFGSTLRVVAPEWQQPPPVDGRIQAALVRDGGVLEMPDGAFDVAVASGNSAQVVGVTVHPGGAAYTDGAAFNVRRAGTAVEAGPTARVVQDPPTGSLHAVADAPFLQPPASDPPTARPGVSGSQTLASITGADVFVETGCAASGCVQSGTETHLLLYSENCQSKWFDSTTKACR